MPIAIRHEDEDDWWHRVASRGEHAPHAPEETAERMVDNYRCLAQPQRVTGLYDKG